MRRRFLKGLDAVFSHYVSLCVAATTGPVISLIAVTLFWELPVSFAILGLVANLLAGALCFIVIKFFETQYHTKIVALLDSETASAPI